jgi:hypothetical protein
MSNMVKVWNDNVYPHKETFKGEEINIPAGSFVEMDYIEAVEFKGQFTAPKTDASGKPDAKFFKKIRVEQPKEPIFKDAPNVLHATGQRADSMAELMQMAKAFAQSNPHLVASDPELDAEGKVTISKAEFESLAARLAALESEKTTKKGPGRPKKEA